MSLTRSVLDNVLAHIQQALPDYLVQLMPNNFKNYQFVHPLGAVLIGYQRSKFSKPCTTDLITQERRLQLRFTVFTRSLGGEQGALDLLDSLRLALVGFQPHHCQQIRLLSERFLGEADGVWRYRLCARTETLQVERRPVVNQQNLVKSIPTRGEIKAKAISQSVTSKE
ncbi:MAG: Gp37 family protein [Snodgrassella sp.]|uniref:Gp37 family protein n=1 Tax=Snodgrassella sp. TaxID=2815304 RepID=UPI00258E68CA|nr:Gp37 family protein [Snodgrassella sp.]MCO6522219.1 Gp37 family protein [Snodgrassella sp.]